MESPDPAQQSDFVLARLAPADVAMFRFLLEAYENLAFFTVLERHPALLKISFSQESRGEVERVLNRIRADINFEWWRCPGMDLQDNERYFKSV